MLQQVASALGPRPPLFGKDEVSIPKNATLIFEHPSIASGPLYIHSGATAIKWAYHLNTQSTPTIGGEVVQVISALVGPIQISGQAAGLKTNKTGQLDPNSEIKGWLDHGTKKAYSPNDELEAIVSWFREYMTLAGSNVRGNQLRNERAITFSYPERGWIFYIQVTNLDGFRYDSTVIAPEWSITAEIVNDNALDYLAGVTMSSFTDDVFTNQQLVGKIGLSAFASSKTETDNPNFGQTGDFGSTNPFLNPELSPSAIEAAKKMGDNFQGLVAAWATGDFAHMGFGALLDNGALPKNVDSAYQQLFGTTVLGSLPGNSGFGTDIPSGTITYGGPANPITKDQIVLDIASTFESVGIPGKVGVAVALDEAGSSLSPDARQPDGDFAMGLFQTFPNGAGGTYSKAALSLALANKQDPVTKYYSVGQQIQDASKWFKAAKDKYYSSQTFDSTTSNETLATFAGIAQGHQGDPTYTQKILVQLGNAASLVAAAQQANPVGGAASGVRLTIINWANKAIQSSNMGYSEGCRRDVENMPPGSWPPTGDCSSTIALIYCWGTDKNHVYATNGSTFNGTTTATIWSTWASREIQPAQARAADLIIWGNNPGDSVHVDMLLEDWNGDQTQLFQHGSGVPHVQGYAGEHQYFTGIGKPPHFFRILP